MAANRRCRSIPCRLLALTASAGSLAASAGSPPQDSQQRGLALLARASLIGDLRSADTPPFRLRAHVKLFPSDAGAQDGEYALTFAAPDRWSVRLAFPGQSEAVGIWEGTRWRMRQGVDTPYRFDETLRLLDIGSNLGLAPEATIREVREGAEGGRSRLCATVAPGKDLWQRESTWDANPSVLAPRNDSSYNLCFDGETGMLTEVRYAPPLPRFTFEGAAQLGNKTSPKTLRCWEGNDLAIEATVAELALVGAADLSGASPPQGAESWPACADPAPPRILVKPEAPRAPHPRAHRKLHTVTCFAEVGSDGLLHDLTPLEAITSALGATVRKALAEWRYQPAACNGVPVPMNVYLAIGLPP